MSDIDESLKIGSIYLAVESGAITITDCLNWLHGKLLSINTVIVYRMICSQLSPNKQYMPNHEHFLVANPDYFPMAYSFGLSVDIPEFDNKLSSKKSLIHRYIQWRSTNPVIIQDTSLICSGSKRDMCLAHIIPNDYSLDEIISTDWLNLLDFSQPKVVEKFIERIQSISRTSYFTKVFLPAYNQYYRPLVEKNIPIFYLLSIHRLLGNSPVRTQNNTN